MTLAEERKVHLPTLYLAEILRFAQDDTITG